MESSGVEWSVDSGGTGQGWRRRLGTSQCTEEVSEAMAVDGNRLENHDENSMGIAGNGKRRMYQRHAESGAPFVGSWEPCPLGLSVTPGVPTRRHARARVPLWWEEWRVSAMRINTEPHSTVTLTVPATAKCSATCTGTRTATARRIACSSLLSRGSAAVGLAGVPWGTARDHLENIAGVSPFSCTPLCFVGLLGDRPTHTHTLRDSHHGWNYSFYHRGNGGSRE